MRERVPKFSFTLHSLSMEEIERRLLAQQLDVGLVPLGGKLAEGLRHKVIIELPPCLLVYESNSLRSASALWKRTHIDDALVCLPPGTPLGRWFSEALSAHDVEWSPSLELPSLDLVARYVAEGYGIGLSVQLPRATPPAGTRMVALPGFPKLPVVAVWSGLGSKLGRAFVEEAETFAKSMKV